MRFSAIDLIHSKIHGIRMLSKYKPSKFEQEINLLIAEEFEDVCRECRNKLKAHELKEELKQVEPPQEKEGFLGGMFK